MVAGEHAVKAAQKAYRECEGDSTESHRAALTAALPFLPVQVAVKKLEWKYVERAVMTYVTSDDRGMLYYINQSFGSDSYYFATVRYSDGTVLYDGDDLPSAKAAAQADYEARILSAIEAASPLSKLKAGNARLEDQLAEARKALDLFEHYGCPICHGDCASANPPVDCCPMEAVRRVREGGEVNG